MSPVPTKSKVEVVDPIPQTPKQDTLLERVQFIEAAVDELWRRMGWPEWKLKFVKNPLTARWEWK